MAVTVQVFTFNAFQENTIVIKDSLNNCIIVDPGCYDRNEQQILLNFIKDNNLRPLALLNTHSHIDHILGNSFVKRTFDMPHYMHIDDLLTMRSVESYAHVYGFNGYEPSTEPSHIIQGGEKLTFGEIELQVLHTPGHAPGHVVYYAEKEGFVINGDVLFKGSFGRVDLPGGDLDILKASIFNVMFKLPEDTIVYCGHGEQTTIGAEKKSNYIFNF
jgi:glyoxylase-like metal-dependent hydrolase (beta-lactamase superfamily II)